MLVAVLVAVGLAGWLAVRAGQVRGALLEARAALSVDASGVLEDPDRLSAARESASASVARARSAVDDPVWRLAAAVPVAGRSFALGRDATRTAGLVVDGVLPPLLAAAAQVQGRPLLSGGRADLDLLSGVAAEVDRAAGPAQQARRTAVGLPTRLLPAGLGRTATDLRAQAVRLADAVDTAQRALAVLPAALGSDGPRRYLMVVQNNAEARGTGGLIGAYAVLEADGGRLRRTAVGSNVDLRTADAPVVDLGPEFAERYDALAGRTLWSSAGLSPDWPSAARVIGGLWQAQSGDRVDGVIGVDPLAMAAVLRVTGAVRLDGRTLTAAGVADFVMRGQYAEGDPRAPERKQRLAGLAGALYDRASAGGYSGPAMLRALAGAASAGHLQAFSQDPAEQALLAPHRVAGALPAAPGAYLQVVDNNAAGNKLDYYVRRQVGYSRPAPGRGRVRVALTNTVVRPEGLSTYVTGRVGDPPPGAEPGQTRIQVEIYVGVGQQVRSVQVDGREVSPRLGTERGHGVASVLVEVAPSRPTVVTADVSDPGGELVYRQQPLPTPDALELAVPHRLA